MVDVQLRVLSHQGQFTTMFRIIFPLTWAKFDPYFDYSDERLAYIC